MLSAGCSSGGGEAEPGFGNSGCRRRHHSPPPSTPGAHGAAAQNVAPFGSDLAFLGGLGRFVFVFVL